MSTEVLSEKMFHRATVAEREALEKQARKEGRTVSNLLRKIQRDYLISQKHRL